MGSPAYCCFGFLTMPLLSQDRLPTNEETAIRSIESISDELTETKEALKNIERKHDDLLKKLDEATVSTIH